MLKIGHPSIAMSGYSSSHFATLSIDNLSYLPGQQDFDGSEQSNIAYAITGRKTWKIMKEKKEIVWPPCIEAALLEGSLSVPLGIRCIDMNNSS